MALPGSASPPGPAVKILGQLRRIGVEADADQAAADSLRSGEPFGEGHGHNAIIASVHPGWRACRRLGSMLGGIMSAALPSKSRTGPRLVLQPASRRAARHTSTSALKRFFAIADAWELSPLQQCRLLKIPSPQVLERYRLGQAPRLSATQQERAALIANIQYSLDRRRRPEGSSLGLGACAARSAAVRRRQPALLHARKRPAGFAGSRPPAGARKRTALASQWRTLRRIARRAGSERLGYTSGLFSIRTWRCECGGIGRRARLRIWWGNPCEFESRLSHQSIGRHCAARRAKPRGLTCRFPSRVSAN